MTLRLTGGLMPYTVEPLSPTFTFGRIVRGLRSSDLEDPKVCQTLKRMWTQYGLIVFRDSEVNDEFQVDLSLVFGELERHPVTEILVDSNPNLIRFTSAPDNANMIEVDGTIGGAWIGWHTDLIYHEHINHGGLLRALQITSHGGATGFIDQIDAYDRLPEATKARIDSHNVVYQLGHIDRFPHAYDGRIRLVKMAPRNQELMDRAPYDFPPVSHPLVFSQPETGRKVLNLSPMFALFIEEMDDLEGAALLADLSDHLVRSPAYHHTWTLGDMVLWDNWRMLHSVSLAPLNEVRAVQRTTITGDYALGRTLPFEVLQRRS